MFCIILFTQIYIRLTRFFSLSYNLTSQGEIKANIRGEGSPRPGPIGGPLAIQPNSRQRGHSLLWLSFKHVSHIQLFQVTQMAVLSRLSVKLWSQLEEENVSFSLALISVLGFAWGSNLRVRGRRHSPLNRLKLVTFCCFFFLYTQFCFFRFINILEVSLEESYHLTKLDWLIVCARKKRQNLQNNSRAISPTAQ